MSPLLHCLLSSTVFRSCCVLWFYALTLTCTPTTSHCPLMTQFPTFCIRCWQGSPPMTSHYSVIRHLDSEVGACPAPTPCHCFLLRLLSSQWFSLWEMVAIHLDHWTEHPPKCLQRAVLSSLSSMLSCQDAEMAQDCRHPHIPLTPIISSPL